MRAISLAVLVAACLPVGMYPQCRDGACQDGSASDGTSLAGAESLIDPPPSAWLGLGGQPDGLRGAWPGMDVDWSGGRGQAWLAGGGRADQATFDGGVAREAAGTDPGRQLPAPADPVRAKAKPQVRARAAPRTVPQGARRQHAPESQQAKR
jgi:hypothetical protein